MGKPGSPLKSNWKSLISVLLAIVGVRIIYSWRLRVSRSAEALDFNQSKEIALPQSRERQRKRKARPVALFAILTALAGIGGWIAFASSSPESPQRPSFNTGGILVFVNDVRETRATINFTVNQSGYFAISVSSSTPGVSSEGEFLVVSSGSGFVVPNSSFTGNATTSDVSEFTNKIRISSVTGDSGEGDRAADDGQGGFSNGSARYLLDGYEDLSDVTVAVGDQYDGILDSDFNSVLCGRLRNPISRSSGGVVLGELPLIGSPGTMKISMLGYDIPSNDLQ
jgi:hypothetical protein